MSTYNRPTLSTSTLIDQTNLINTFPFNATDYSEYANVINNFTNPIIIDGLDTGSLLLTETTIKGNQRNLSITTTNGSTLNLNDNKVSGDLLINNNSTNGNTFIKAGNIYFDANQDQSISYNDPTKTTITKDSVKSPSFIGTVSKAGNIGGGSAGQLLYQSALDTTAKLSAGSNGNILTYGGSSAPVWTDFTTSLFTTNRITEVIKPVTGGATVTCDYSISGIFSTTAHTANFTIAITNVPTTENRTINITLLINSSTNKFYGNTITVNGLATSPIINGGSSSISVSSATLIIQQITVLYIASTTPTYVISSVNSVF